MSTYIYESSKLPEFLQPYSKQDTYQKQNGNSSTINTQSNTVTIGNNNGSKTSVDNQPKLTTTVDTVAEIPVSVNPGGTDMLKVDPMVIRSDEMKYFDECVWCAGECVLKPMITIIDEENVVGTIIPPNVDVHKTEDGYIMRNGDDYISRKMQHTIFSLAGHYNMIAFRDSHPEMLENGFASLFKRGSQIVGKHLFKTSNIDMLFKEIPTAIGLIPASMMGPEQRELMHNMAGSLTDVWSSLTQENPTGKMKVIGSNKPASLEQKTKFVPPKIPLSVAGNLYNAPDAADEMNYNDILNIVGAPDTKSAVRASTNPSDQILKNQVWVNADDVVRSAGNGAALTLINASEKIVASTDVRALGLNIGSLQTKPNSTTTKEVIALIPDECKEMALRNASLSGNDVNLDVTVNGDLVTHNEISLIQEAVNNTSSQQLGTVGDTVHRFKHFSSIHKDIEFGPIFISPEDMPVEEFPFKALNFRTSSESATIPVPVDMGIYAAGSQLSASGDIVGLLNDIKKISLYDPLESQVTESALILINPFGSKLKTFLYHSLDKGDTLYNMQMAMTVKVTAFKIEGDKMLVPDKANYTPVFMYGTAESEDVAAIPFQKESDVNGYTTWSLVANLHNLIVNKFAAAINKTNNGYAQDSTSFNYGLLGSMKDISEYKGMKFSMSVINSGINLMAKRDLKSYIYEDRHETKYALADYIGKVKITTKYPESPTSVPNAWEAVNRLIYPYLRRLGDKFLTPEMIITRSVMINIFKKFGILAPDVEEVHNKHNRFYDNKQTTVSGRWTDAKMGEWLSDVTNDLRNWLQKDNVYWSIIPNDVKPIIGRKVWCLIYNAILLLISDKDSNEYNDKLARILNDCETRLDPDYANRVGIGALPEVSSSEDSEDEIAPLSTYRSFNNRIKNKMRTTPKGKATRVSRYMQSSKSSAMYKSSSIRSNSQDKKKSLRDVVDRINAV